MESVRLSREGARGSGEAARGHGGRQGEVQRCKCGEAACKGAKVNSLETREGGAAWGMGEAGEKCKGANAAKPRAKVQKWETKFRVAGEVGACGPRAHG